MELGSSDSLFDHVAAVLVVIVRRVFSVNSVA